MREIMAETVDIQGTQQSFEGEIRNPGGAWLTAIFSLYYGAGLMYKSIFLSVTLLFGLAGQPALAKTFFVTTDGNDSNQGTSSAPLKTFAKACALAKQGDNIQLGAGMFYESENCDLKNGVSVDGILERNAEGKPIKSSSTVLINRSLTHRKCAFPNAQNEILLNLTNKRDISIGDIYFDGNERKTGQGILVDNGADYRDVPSNIELTNVALVNFHHNAVRFKQTRNSSLSNSYIHNSSMEYAPGECNTNGYSNGNIMISGGSTDVAVDNNRIVTSGFYGYGIDGSGTTGTKITNNIFEMHPDQKWKSDPSRNWYAGNFNIEFFGGHDRGVLIEGNQFDQTVSLITADKNVVKKPYRFLIKNNYFDIQREYSVELGSSGIHVENNLFTSSSGRAYAVLRNFGANDSYLLQDIKVTGNVADGGQFSFFHSSLSVKNLFISNNTTIFRNYGSWKDKPSTFITGNRSAEDIIENNLAINFKAIPLGGLPASETNHVFDITNNTSPLVETSLLRTLGSGDSKEMCQSAEDIQTCYALADNNELTDIGKDIGLVYVGEAPDIGAVEQPSASSSF